MQRTKNEMRLAEEAKLVASIRSTHSLPESAPIGRVVHIVPGGWGLIKPIASNGMRQEIYVHFSNVLKQDDDAERARLYLNQIVTYLVDANGKKGPRAVDVQVLEDPQKDLRLKRSA